MRGARSRRRVRTAVGNLVAWWEGCAGPGAVVTGSHLDSVLDGGAYDGPLGVVSALAAIDVLRARGFVPPRPLGVSVFVEEEGSRFGLACLGSRLATGAVSWEARASCATGRGVPGRRARGRRAAGTLGRAACSTVSARSWSCTSSRAATWSTGRRAVGVASGIWPHGRYRYDFTGAADHAGTTRMEDRADPMLTYAMTALAANKQARLAGQRATFGRLEVTPNSTNSVPVGGDRVAGRAGVVRRRAGGPGRRHRAAGVRACLAGRHRARR